MAHSIISQKEFVHQAYDFLEKLEKEKLWNKDTLVVALDKSSRPLVHALRKISNIKNKQNPEIRFLNYSCRKSGISKNKEEKANKIAAYLRRSVDPEKFSHYKKILILDDFVCSGKTFLETHEILKKYFGEENTPKVKYAALESYIDSVPYKVPHDKNNMIYGSYAYDALDQEAIDTGLKDKVINLGNDVWMNETARDNSKRKSFLFYRKNLSRLACNHAYDMNYAKKQEALSKKPKIKFLEKIFG